MARESEENAIHDKALGKALTGGLCGLGAALAFAAAAMLAFNASAFSQAPVERPSLASALEECESGAMEGAETARALGACDVLMRSGELDESMRARVLVNRGLIAMDRGVVRAGRDDLEQAVRLAPDLGEAWLNLAAARIKAGAYSDAVDAARQARETGANRAQSLFNEAIALEHLDRYDAAYDAYVAAAEAAPDDATLQAQPRRFRRHQG